MRAMKLGTPVSLDTLALEERHDPEPARGEILVRVHASSLNYHDLMVAKGFIPHAEGLIPMSDGAGMADAFRYQESGQHFGKICLEF